MCLRLSYMWYNVCRQEVQEWLKNDARVTGCPLMVEPI